MGGLFDSDELDQRQVLTEQQLEQAGALLDASFLEVEGDTNQEKALNWAEQETGTRDPVELNSMLENRLLFPAGPTEGVQDVAEGGAEAGASIFSSFVEGLSTPALVGLGIVAAIVVATQTDILGGSSA